MLANIVMTMPIKIFQNTTSLKKKATVNFILGCVYIGIQKITVTQFTKMSLKKMFFARFLFPRHWFWHKWIFIFSLPNSGSLQSLPTPKDNLINELTPEKISPFLKNNLKLPQENLVKTAIDNYIKKLTVSFANESYFLYDKSDLTTFVTELNKLISIHGCFSYFNKKDAN